MYCSIHSMACCTPIPTPCSYLSRLVPFQCNKAPWSSCICTRHVAQICRIFVLMADHRHEVNQGCMIMCRVIKLCERCGLLRFCPQVALLLWAHAQESLLSSAATARPSKQDMLELATAAVRAASFTVGADGMHASLLYACRDAFLECKKERIKKNNAAVLCCAAVLLGCVAQCGAVLSCVILCYAVLCCAAI